MEIYRCTDYSKIPYHLLHAMSVADNKARRDQSPPPTEVRLVLLVREVHYLFKYVKYDVHRYALTPEKKDRSVLNVSCPVEVNQSSH